MSPSPNWHTVNSKDGTWYTCEDGDGGDAHVWQEGDRWLMSHNHASPTPWTHHDLGEQPSFSAALDAADEVVDKFYEQEQQQAQGEVMSTDSQNARKYPALIEARWDDRWGHPRWLCCRFSEVPDLEDFRFERRGPYYLAELDGHVSHFHYRGPGDGFYGQDIPIRMKDGSTETLHGPFTGSYKAPDREGFSEYRLHNIIVCETQRELDGAGGNLVGYVTDDLFIEASAMAHEYERAESVSLDACAEMTRGDQELMKSWVVPLRHRARPPQRARSRRHGAGPHTGRTAVRRSSSAPARWD